MSVSQATSLAQAASLMDLADEYAQASFDVCLAQYSHLGIGSRYEQEARKEARAALRTKIYEAIAEHDREVERYRWLRDVVCKFDEKRKAVYVAEFISAIAYGENIDAAIDQAMESEK